MVIAGWSDLSSKIAPVNKLECEPVEEQLDVSGFRIPSIRDFVCTLDNVRMFNALSVHFLVSCNCFEVYMIPRVYTLLEYKFLLNLIRIHNLVRLCLLSI